MQVYESPERRKYKVILILYEDELHRTSGETLSLLLVVAKMA